MINQSRIKLLATMAIASIAILCVTYAEARKIRTKNAAPKISQKDIETDHSNAMDSIISIYSDSISFVTEIKPAVRFYGFDKTITSNNESFFISNGLDRPIRTMEVNITYTDMKGRQLHRRNVQIESYLEPGETKRYDIKSWDTQKSFYFHQSVKPKRQATPFSVKIELLSLTPGP